MVDLAMVWGGLGKSLKLRAEKMCSELIGLPYGLLEHESHADDAGQTREGWKEAKALLVPSV